MPDLARQVSLNRVVALKMILQGASATEEEVSRFHIEAEAVGKLKHPHIVPIYEVGEYQGTCYFSMAYIAGHNLHQLVADAPLPARTAAAYLVKVCDAIACAHGLGVLHRDLKPQNILLDQQGEPQVTDFGLAKRMGETVGVTSTGRVLGTPAYMPPEQALGDNKRIGPASDVYASGATLYALLTTRPPFQADTPAATILQVMTAEPVPPRRLNPSVPRDLETIIQKAMQKQPAARYASAADLRDDLQRFLDHQPIRARPIGAIERGWRWCWSNPLPAVSVLGVVVALVCVAVAGWMIARGEYNTRLRTEQMNVEQRRRLAKLATEAGIQLANEGQLASGLSQFVESLRMEDDPRRVAVQRRRIHSLLKHMSLVRRWFHDAPDWRPFVVMLMCDCLTCARKIAGWTSWRDLRNP